MTERPDPLAPPPRHAKPVAGRSHEPEQEPDFSRCCTGCGSFSVLVLTLGCTDGEHVGEFGYCGPHAQGPFFCGRCQEHDPKPAHLMVKMKILRQRYLHGSTMQEKIDKLFDGKMP